MDSFKSSDKIILNEGDEFVAHRFHLTQATTADGRGFIPFGLDATSVETIVFASDGTSVTHLVVDYDNIADNIITVALSYPENQIDPGQYTIRFKIGFSNVNTKLNAYFSRLYLVAGLE
jgi:hypothetical protein